MEIAEKKGVSMTEVSLAWLLTKVTSPVVGATKRSHVDGGVKAVDLVLSEEEIDCLEELYVLMLWQALWHRMENRWPEM